MVARNFQQKTIGVACGILSAFFVAGYITTNKHIFANSDIGAIEYAFIFSIMGAVFGLVSLLTQLSKESATKIGKNFASFGALGFAGAMAVGLFAIGQYYTTAINAALLMTSTIVATALFSHIFLKERHSKQQYIWVAILFVGLYIGIVGFHKMQLRSGDLIVLASVLFFGFGNAYSRVVMRRIGGASLVPDVRLTIGGLLALLIFPFVVRDMEVVLSIAPLALLAGLFYWLCMKTFALAVHLVNANNAIVLNNSHIFFTSIAGVLLLSEQYSIEKFVGSIIAITSIYFIAYKHHR